MPGRLRGRDGHAPPLHDADGPRRRARSRSSAFALPALGFAAGSALFDRPPVEWKPIGPDGRLPGRHLRPARDHRGRRHRPGRQDDDLRARAQRRRPAAEPARLRRAVHRALDSLHAPRLPGALRRCRASASSARATAASTTSTARSTAGRPCGRSIASTRACNDGQVEVGARYSVNSEFRRFPSYRDPAQDLDGIGQYLYPGRFSTPKMD